MAEFSCLLLLLLILLLVSFIRFGALLKFVLEIQSCLVWILIVFLGLFELFLYKTKKLKKHFLCFLFLHFKGSKNILSYYLLLLWHFCFHFAISFEAFVRFLAFGFWLDFGEELSLISSFCC